VSLLDGIANRFTHQLRLQATDAGLQLWQQRRFAGQRFGLVQRVTLVDGLAVVQRKAEVLRDAAKRNQQRVADLEVQRIRIILPLQQESAVGADTPSARGKGPENKDALAGAVRRPAAPRARRAVDD
jgi:hypothetical protein